MIALRDIAPGEEITHSCKCSRSTPPSREHALTTRRAADIPLGVAYAERQEQIRGWGFNCTCALCTAPDAQRRVSDRRRRRLYAIHTELAHMARTGEALSAADTTEADRGAKRLRETVDEMLFIIDKEQAWPVLCDYYVAVARAHLAMDDAAGARRYWQAAAAAWATYGGEQHENADAMRALDRAIAAQEATG